jgi:predicted nucleotidyltransferase component of viral defense system
MPSDELLMSVSTRTGIQMEKIKKEILVLQTMPILFNLLENNKQKVGLYGGTALNKIYFGKRQRFSYDLDLLCYDYKKTIKILSDNNAKNIGLLSDKRAEFNYNGIKLDLWSVKKTEEQPRGLQATSLLSFFDYPVVNSFVPSYSLEYLLARKILAMASRSLIKDVYDSWLGLQLLKDRKKFEKYLNKLENIENIDCRKTFKDTIARNTDYYKNKSVDAINAPKAEAMIKGIIQMLEY